MANYIDVSMLTERVQSARLNALCNVTGAEQTSLLSNVIARAESLIDGFAATRYPVPLPASELAAEWGLCIAEYELYKRSPSGEVPAKIRQSYEDTLVLLQELAAGKLNIPSAAPLRNSSGASLSVHSATAMSDEESMRGF
ncbi:MAG: hypothetical protein A2X49_06600 [Lentisphaerae bacterium GWF2_52_8]|nr:MAG: hypothetical protein A2X49_06600 [Lentisphaerae bacterium GWF2_52_8]